MNFISSLMFLFGCEQEIKGDTAEENIITPSDLVYGMACSSSYDVGYLTIVVRNEDFTKALIIREYEGYPQGGGSWSDGFDSEKVSIELHTGINVGRNYCTDMMEDEYIEQLYRPIDSSELPASIEATQQSELFYGVDLLDCEGCEPLASLNLEHLWFHSEDGNYVLLENVYFSDAIMFNYGG
ncbi:MAG: hypothetical protein CMK59_00490 [Proteobacteria bacterium]|nr:hypothetical protein [Pseudomonadota bacterium]